MKQVPDLRLVAQNDESLKRKQEKKVFFLPSTTENRINLYFFKQTSLIRQGAYPTKHYCNSSVGAQKSSILVNITYHTGYRLDHFCIANKKTG